MYTITFFSIHAPFHFLHRLTTLNISHIDLKKILPPKFDSRTVESPEADTELRDSIQQFGVLEPILVKPKGDDYEIIFGHRRYRMACVCGLPSIPCIISSAGEKEVEIIKVHENLHRLPTSHIDQGRTFLYLRDTFSMTETEIAALINKSVPYVSQHLTLLETDPDIVDAVHSGLITFSSARELCQTKNPHERKRLLKIVVDSGATVDVLHNWIQQANNSTDPDGPGPVYEQNNTIHHPHVDPTFPCQSCDCITPIAQMQIIRLCPVCDFQFRQAVDLVKKELTPKK